VAGWKPPSDETREKPSSPVREADALLLPRTGPFEFSHPTGTGDLLTHHPNGFIFSPCALGPLETFSASRAFRYRGVKMKALGYHLILELEGCPSAVLDDEETVRALMTKAVSISGATMIQPFFHRFSPQGVSGVVIISESHFSIHTWPEYGYAAIDIFTCGDQIDMEIAAETLRRGFRARSLQKMLLTRGMLDLPDEMIRHKPEPALHCLPET